jgi:small subunit ribosomal protein S3
LPQIEVEEVPNPDLNAQIMAERLAYSLDRGRHYRRAGYYILRKIMDSGAKGTEIIVSGKVTSQRARTTVFRAGTMKKSGQPAQEGVDRGVAQCIQKSGTLGIIVKIMHADIRLGDTVKINDEALAKIQTKKLSELTKTKIEKDYEVSEEERDLTAAEKELFDEVEEEDISEISIESDKESEDQTEE